MWDRDSDVKDIGRDRYLVEGVGVCGVSAYAENLVGGSDPWREVLGEALLELGGRNISKLGNCCRCCICRSCISSK